MAREAYPRPDFDRSHRWLSLNGAWDFRADLDSIGLEEHWEQASAVAWPEHIQVPFAWETPASGIGREWLPVGWYRYSLVVPSTWANERTILHFGAVHYHCRVWINGRWIGEHTGGYLPFSFDITDALQQGKGELVVRVEAPLDKHGIPHGKQRSLPADGYDDCAFTTSSGIWQSVWLEGRPATFIRHVRLSSARNLDRINLKVELQGSELDCAHLSVSIDGTSISQQVPVLGTTSLAFALPIEQPRLWNPSDPYLYHITLQLQSKAGTDQAKCYTGLRTVEVQEQRVLLNGEPLYLRGALDQGYWPEGGYTPPNDEDLRQDVELALRAGYNLIRKHIKLEDPLWLYYADQLGLLVWAEPPCVGHYSPEAIALFDEQLPLMVERDGNHPAIVLWGIYNEEWGLDWRSAQDREKQEAVARACDLLAACDRSHPIVDDSGWNHVKTDILDWHYYDEDNRRWSEVTAALANNPQAWFEHYLNRGRLYCETRLCVSGHPHPAAPIMNGEYGAGKSDLERGWYLRWQTQEMRRHPIFSGYIYTELYDVEYELCGIYDAQRRLKPLGCDPAHVNAETTVFIVRFSPAGPRSGLPGGSAGAGVPCSSFSLREPGTLREAVLVVG